MSSIPGGQLKYFRHRLDMWVHLHRRAWAMVLFPDILELYRLVPVLGMALTGTAFLQKIPLNLTRTTCTFRRRCRASPNTRMARSTATTMAKHESQQLLRCSTSF